MEGRLKESVGISQRTYMKDPWAWTMVRGLIMEVECGWGGRRRRGKKWDNCNSINNKIF